MEEKCKRCNPWFSLWSCPRTTMRLIIDEDPRRWVHVIMVISGAIMGLFTAFGVTDPTEMVTFGSLFATLIGYAVAGAIFNIILVYALGLLLKWVGHWFGGSGTYVGVRSAVAWTNIPLIWLGILKAFELLLYGTVFPWALTQHQTNPAMTPLAYVFAAINLMLMVWIIVILVRTVAEAHRFSSSWLSLLSLVISAVLFLIGLAIVAGISDFVMTLPIMSGLTQH